MTGQVVQEPPRIAAPGRRRRRAAALVLLAACALAAVVVVDPLRGSARAGGAGVTDNSYPTRLARVTRRALTAQTDVAGTLGYRGSAAIRIPSGTAPAALKGDEQTVAEDRSALVKARASITAEGEHLTEARAGLASAHAALASERDTLADARATVLAAQDKESIDCAGDGAVESSAGGAGGVESAGGAVAGTCAADIAALSSARQSAGGASGGLAGARAKIAAAHKGVSAVRSAIAGAERSIAAAEKLLGAARESLREARAATLFYAPHALFTALPREGAVIRRGQTLYEAGGQEVVLMYGRRVASRAFRPRMSPGADVAELNANLEALGYGEGLGGRAFTAATEGAVRAFQGAHAMAPTGELALGSVAFAPAAVRVTSVKAQAGSPVKAGTVLGVSSTVRGVSIALEASEQSYVRVGDRVTITLPDNHTIPGRVSYVASVASSGSSSSDSSSPPTVDVEVTPCDRAATGDLDEAPVEVAITTASVHSALTVPVDGLIALTGGGYAVEEVSARGRHRLVPVEVGLFDDAAGLVQVSGPGLAAGRRLVVPGE